MRIFVPQFNKSKNSNFYWITNYYHCDNNFTMQKFIEKYLPDDFEIISNDSIYAKVKHLETSAVFSLNLKSDGNSFHRVE